MEETLAKVSDSIDELESKFYGVVVAKVVNPLDPLMLGRVQVQLTIAGGDLSAWARVAVPMAGTAHGTYFIPNVGDEVLLAFENGDLNAPYVIGCLWTAAAPPPLPSPIPQIRMIRTPAGNQITFMDIPPTITINTPAGQTVVLSPTGVNITDGKSIINLTPDGASITGTPNLTLTAAAKISISAPTVEINGAAKADLKSGGMTTVQGSVVKIN